MVQRAQPTTSPASRLRAYTEQRDGSASIATRRSICGLTVAVPAMITRQSCSSTSTSFLLRGFACARSSRTARLKSFEAKLPNSPLNMTSKSRSPPSTGATAAECKKYTAESSRAKRVHSSHWPATCQNQRGRARYITPFCLLTCSPSPNLAASPASRCGMGGKLTSTPC